tara:strand:+ start:181 stop:1035 length:855 start_codon:yes stop_codon:yes gene_type:complete
MICFVGDLFLKDYVGGAELTSDAIIQKCPFQVKTFYSHELTQEEIEKNKNSFWIFGNTAQLPHRLFLYAAKNLNYSIIEYDYKFCKYRSIEKHTFFEKFCDCEKQLVGKRTAIFYYNAKHIFWMAQKQRDIYLDKFKILKKCKNIVLSSVFDEDTLQKIKDLDVSSKNNKWAIVGSQSWVKGTDKAIKYAKENNLEYEIIFNKPYDEALDILSRSKGLMFFPPGADTCPRITIEAKLLNCKLILNDNVQHKDESWFNLDKKKMIEYLSGRPNLFWNTIEGDLST